MDGQEQKQVREYDPVMGWGMATYAGSHRVSFEPEGKQSGADTDPDFYPAYSDDDEDDDNRPDNRDDFEREPEEEEVDENEEDTDGGEDADENEADTEEGGEGSEEAEDAPEGPEEGEASEGEGIPQANNAVETPGGAGGVAGESAGSTGTALEGAALPEGAVAAEGLALPEEALAAEEGAALLANPWVAVIGLVILVIVVIAVIMVAGFSKSGGAGGGGGGGGAGGGFFDCSGKVYSFPYAEIGVPTIPKTHHNYSAIDLMSPDGQDLVAVTDGVVKNPHFTDSNKGGIGFTLAGADGYTYYYAHLEYLDPKMKSGYTLKAGEYVGRSGHTGNASASAPHLHFGISSSGHPTKGYYPAELERDAPTAQESPWQTLEAWKNGQCIKPGT